MTSDYEFERMETLNEVEGLLGLEDCSGSEVVEKIKMLAAEKSLVLKEIAENLD